MKVLLISLDVFDGGASRCVRELRDGLIEAGHSCTVWVAQKGPGSAADVHCFRQPWERFLSPLDYFPHLTDWRHRGAIHALDGLRPGQFDIVHFHIIHLGCVSLQAAARLCRRMPVVWTLHDEWAVSGLICDLRGRMAPERIKRLTVGPMRYVPLNSYHDNYRARSIRRLFVHHLPQPRRLISPSHFIADRAAASGRFAGVPIDVVRNAVPIVEHPATTWPRTQARERLGLTPNVPVVALVAPRLDLPHKGTLLGIEALEALPDRRATQVLLVGRGTERITGRLTGGPVRTLVASSDQVLIDAYRSADVTLVPSLSESFSLVAAESLACATPVVAFRTGGQAEVVFDGERGLTATPYEVGDLSQCVQRLFAEPELRHRLGSAGRDWVFRHCRLRDVVARTIAIYEQACRCI